MTNLVANLWLNSALACRFAEHRAAVFSSLAVAASFGRVQLTIKPGLVAAVIGLGVSLVSGFAAGLPSGVTT